MAELIDVFNAIIKNRDKWVSITDDEKSKNFFIINRYFCKIYPDKAQLLNIKNIDKIMAMDIWFHFMKTQPYPKNFWSKSPKIEKEIFDKEYKLLLRSLKIKDIDLDYLIDRHPDFIKEELTYLKKLEKEFKNK